MDFVHLFQNGIGIQIFQGIKHTHRFSWCRLTIHGHLTIGGPFGNGRGRHLLAQESLTESIVFEGMTQPIHALGKSLKGTCRCMDTIVTRIGLALESQFLVLVQNISPDRTGGSTTGVGRSQYLGPKVLPTQRVGGPRYGVPQNFFTGCRVGRTHFHVEAVHDVDVVDLATVKATTELDEILATGEGAPLFVETGSIHTEFGSTILGIVDLSSRNDVVPFFAKHGFKASLALFGNDQLLGLQLYGLAGNGTVMRINVHILVNRLGQHFTLGGDANAMFGQR
mmetsp:Transcript_24916/g.58043  ORF Transcript_24916/g.58043 Transcript_24916/m.58043 type:complete len:281 (-) Transcript_24916:417-1259(-)